MKKNTILIIFILLFPNLCLADSEYWFEDLTANAEKYTADFSLQRIMKKYTGEDYKDCERQLKESGKEMGNYFSFVPINLGKQKDSTFLVFPSKRCFAFFGMHSVQFWIVRRENSNSYRVLLSARQDGIKVIDKFTNEYADLELLYNRDSLVYSYNGKKYLNKKHK